MVAVNKNDLERIMHFDLKASVSAAIGVFLLSGSIWLGLEKWLEQPEFEWTRVMAVAAASILFGLVFLALGLWDKISNRRYIQSIFDETNKPR